MGAICSGCMGKDAKADENVKDKAAEDVKDKEQNVEATEKNDTKQEGAEDGKVQEANGGDAQKKEDKQEEEANQMSNEIVQDAVAEASQQETTDQ